MKKWTMIVIIGLILIPIVTGALYWDELTVGVANTLYCTLVGCDMQGDIDMGGNVIRNATLENVTIINATVYTIWI